MSDAGKGLENVVVAESGICAINGDIGELVYRGYLIQDLAENTTFEEVSYLLWSGNLPNQSELDALVARLAVDRALVPSMDGMMRYLPRRMEPIDGVRTLVSALSADCTNLGDHSAEANQEKSARILAQVPTLLAAFKRYIDGLEPIASTDHPSLAHNFLTMLTGQEPDPFVAHTLDVALVLHAEHGMNASTFAGRVTCATLSDIYAGVVAAMGALKGPLHGGANAVVLAMLREIGSPEKADAYVKSVLSGARVVPGIAPKRIPGFGHRVYTAMDPRATVLRAMSHTLAEKAGMTQWIEISEAVVNACENAGMYDKGIYPNVDFFSASCYYTMGIDESLFTSVFAMSRVAGWTAHMMEQHADNRLIRPRAQYVGERGRHVVPIGQR